MRRPTLHASLLTLSLLLTVAFAAALLLPVRLGPYFAARDQRSSTFDFEINNRHLRIYFLTHPLTPREPSAWVAYHDAGEDTAFSWPIQGNGLEYERIDWISNSSDRVVIRGHQFQVSWWWFLLTFLTITALLAFPHLRRLAQKSSADPRSAPCPHCDYDLRAHSPGETCPECGMQVK